ncbi:GNAT family N-acetyltransferase [uncultured Sulfitobacter sp.]|uniref:GNAT family N-acetyltransferase n=1 Tax=uncultured Sulfitobacter sp. TaxID=191468 RepID=UPI00261ACC51|nr:GNAT family N-acetyltransferase [uncultured Sulfitobacter sp.]
MLIRAAQRADLQVIKTLWNGMISDTVATFTSTLKSDADLSALLAARADRFLVAEDAGGVRGFVTWGPFRAGDGYVHTAEHSSITDTARKGTGRMLMTACLETAASQNIRTMIAGIGHENAAAVAFHTRLGFAMAGRLPQVGRKNGRWHDLILMHRPTAKP